MIIEKGSTDSATLGNIGDDSQQIFSLFDKDSDGRIPVDELGSLLRALNRAPSQAEIEELSKKHFSSGFITSSDLPLLLTSIPQVNSDHARAELLAAFKVLDKTGEGRIPSEELKRLVMTVGERMTLSEADEMMKMADPEKTGFVEYDKFIKRLIL